MSELDYGPVKTARVYDRRCGSCFGPFVSLNTQEAFPLELCSPCLHRIIHNSPPVRPKRAVIIRTYA